MYVCMYLYMKFERNFPCQQKGSRSCPLLISFNGTSFAVSHWKLRMDTYGWVSFQPSQPKQAILRTGKLISLFFPRKWGVGVVARVGLKSLGSLRSTTRGQRQRHNFAYLINKYKSFARPSRAFFISVHFLLDFIKLPIREFEQSRRLRQINRH